MTCLLSFFIVFFCLLQRTHRSNSVCFSQCTPLENPSGFLAERAVALSNVTDPVLFVRARSVWFFHVWHCSLPTLIISFLVGLSIKLHQFVHLFVTFWKKYHTTDSISLSIVWYHFIHHVFNSLKFQLHITIRVLIAAHGQSCCPHHFL